MEQKIHSLDDLNILSGSVIDAAMAVHKALGPGLLESVYEACLDYELRKRGLSVRRQVSCPVIYDGVHVDANLRLDMVVQDQILVELKAIEKILPVHKAQVLTYLKLSKLRLGLLLNFNVALLKNGIERIAL